MRSALSRLSGNDEGIVVVASVIVVAPCKSSRRSDCCLSAGTILEKSRLEQNRQLSDANCEMIVDGHKLAACYDRPSSKISTGCSSVRFSTKTWPCLASTSSPTVNATSPTHTLSRALI